GGGARHVHGVGLVGAAFDRGLGRGRCLGFGGLARYDGRLGPVSLCAHRGGLGLGGFDRGLGRLGLGLGLRVGCRRFSLGLAFGLGRRRLGLGFGVAGLRFLGARLLGLGRRRRGRQGLAGDVGAEIGERRLVLVGEGDGVVQFLGLGEVLSPQRGVAVL